MEEVKPKTNYKALGIFMLIVALVFLIYLFKSDKRKVNEESYIEESFAFEVTKEGNPKVKIEMDNNVESRLDEKPAKEEMEQQIAILQQSQEVLQQRLTAPLMVFNNPAESDSEISKKDDKNKSIDSNTRFLESSSKRELKTEFAQEIADLSSVILQGNLIHAVLESASNSDLPGPLRAIVVLDHYSEDGSRVLIPRGSRLIGEYKSGMLQGQTRIFIVWNRVITPDGISIKLSSQGIDNLGVAGMAADKVNRHFWQRFGSAVLLSMLSTGTSSLGNSDLENPTTLDALKASLANGFSQAATQNLQTNANIAPTLETYQGKRIIVFVAQDLNFEKLNQVNSKINIF